MQNKSYFLYVRSRPHLSTHGIHCTTCSPPLRLSITIVQVVCAEFPPPPTPTMAHGSSLTRSESRLSGTGSAIVSTRGLASGPTTCPPGQCSPGTVTCTAGGTCTTAGRCLWVHCPRRHFEVFWHPQLQVPRRPPSRHGEDSVVVGVQVTVPEVQWYGPNRLNDSPAPDQLIGIHQIYTGSMIFSLNHITFQWKYIDRYFISVKKAVLLPKLQFISVKKTWISTENTVFFREEKLITVL